MIERNAKIILFALALTGCGEDQGYGGGRGSVEFNVYGEDFIEKGIPAAEFKDGWDVTFSRFLVVLGNVSVGTESNAAGTIEGTQLFDLVSEGPHVVGSIRDLDARAWDTVGYEIRPANAATSVHESATEDDLQRVGPCSVYVSGNAVKGAQDKHFEWCFTNSTLYRPCFWESEGRELQGIVVKNAVTESVQLTLHGDHLFYDDLTADDAVLRFDSFARADTNGDDEITLEELSDLKLVDIAPEDGTYGTGSVSNVDDLGAFVTALTRTLGHFQGEGHCTETQL